MFLSVRFNTKEKMDKCTTFLSGRIFQTLTVEYKGVVIGYYVQYIPTKKTM